MLQVNSESTIWKIIRFAKDYIKQLYQMFMFVQTFSKVWGWYDI